MEAVIAAPLLSLVLMTIVQFALWSHAEHVAQSAAAQGLAAARVLNGTAGAGTHAAEQTLLDMGDGPLANAAVHTSRTETNATVTVTGTATSVIPFLTLPVHGNASGVVEQFRTDLDTDGR